MFFCNIEASKRFGVPPWHAGGLQDAGDVHVPTPDVKLPLLKAQDPAEDGPRVHADPHVHLLLQLAPNIPADGNTHTDALCCKTGEERG